MSRNISIILPAKNEAESLEELLPELRRQFPEEEIIVVDDGSTDATVDICNQNEIKVISHIYSMGNGAAIKTGTIRTPSSEYSIMIHAQIPYFGQFGQLSNH